MSLSGRPESSGKAPLPLGSGNIVHNEITKLKANTINAVAIALFITGGVAPLAGAATLGVSISQIGFGLIWIAIGLVLHSVAKRILQDLLP